MKGPAAANTTDAARRRAAAGEIAAAPRYKGAVGRLTPSAGLQGWCVNLDDPGAPVELELSYGDVAVGRTMTRILRLDVCQRLGLKGRFGFAFGPEAFVGLRGEAAMRRELLSVRVAGGNFQLPQSARTVSPPQLAGTAEPGERDAEIAQPPRRAMREEDGSEGPHRLEPARDGAAKSDAVPHIHVDAAAALSGFGVFLKGWIYSPARPVCALALRLGDREIGAAPESVGFSPRPDLLSVFPSAHEAAGRAGFRCLFRCEALVPSAATALKIVYEDGAATSHDLADVVFERASLDENGGRFRDFYPFMEREAVFADYARAYYREAERRYGVCRISALQPAPLAWAFVAPPQRHRLFLMFARLRESLPRFRGVGVGVLMLAEEGARHGELEEQMHALRGDFGGPCQVGYVADGRRALWALDAALTALKARRFVYVGSDAVLSAPGWDTAAALLPAKAPLTFLELEDPCARWDAPERSMRAFVWDASSFAAWRREGLLPLASPPTAASWGSAAEWKSGCGFLTAAPATSPTLQQIDRLVGAASTSVR